MEKLEGKVALITGGNSGIGLTAAKLFIAEGAKVVITGRNPTTLNAAEEELGSNVLAIQAEAANPSDMENVVAQAVATFGRLDRLRECRHFIANASRRHGAVGFRGSP
ncbi:SDR family NAD(P)-dependent oxidoreductase [Paenibacillus sp. PFR10]|uniref:SDR family NAD(P)-dependent oxidoreductase n=1 Tax=Paenibacillus violae TaxID=3077234 RepID=A0ABU3RQ92_9BACL|nr:SDR family NAD(P)-dependent oxidoreductase [Paenibacillus sp. PFR10]MDU0206464.1 SDR family NAD(P)-dependent oxidoreductase [Paenibacillus sp. PFR10]